MVVGIGTDLLKIKDLHVEYLNHADPFMKKTFTENELKEAGLRAEPKYYYAARFAGKEAVFKSLNREADGVYLNEIEILNKKSGQPYVVLHGDVKRCAEQAGIRTVLISLSYEKEYTIAYAIADDGNQQSAMI